MINILQQGKLMKKLTCFMLLLLTALTMSFPSTGWTQTIEEIKALNEPYWQEIVDYAQENLSLEGTLLKKGAYIYLKIDKDYLNVLNPLLGLEEKGFMKPKTPNIRVLSDAEWRNHYPLIPLEWEEIGQTFHLTLEEITIVKTRVNPDNYSVILRVQSPDLAALRAKYGLDTWPHQFYISLATRHY